MIEFIQRLQKRYQSEQQNASPTSELFQSCSAILKTLTLAETSLLKQQWIQSSSNFPLNIVVFGPTQAGKSTLVNCLLSEPLAGVSSLAGFTVHPQGFTTGLGSNNSWLKEIFPDYQQSDQKDLDHSNLSAFTLTDLASSRFQTDQKPSIVWDTPDFDSVDANGYIESVLRTIGVADILILTVSKEKYADQSVWDMLELLAPLQKSLLVCINKLAKNEEQTLFRSFTNRYKSILPDYETPSLVSIPFFETKNDSVSDQIEAEKIIATANSMIRSLNRNDQGKINSNFIEIHWDEWIKPIEEELEDQQEWQEYFQKTLDSAMQTYRNEFLDHPDYYDTFQRAMAELLQLLEIPGLVQSLGKTREVITWPVRTLFKFGKNVFQSDAKKIDSGRDKSYEADLLRQLVEQVLTDLASSSFFKAREVESFSSLRQQEFHRLLSQSRTTIAAQFAQQVSIYQTEFDQEIQSSAQQLYTRLEQQPALLNSLRAARVSTDAAAVVFALKTGGLSLNDFILAPAMLSLTTYLTESSVGQYINTVKAKLKARQYETVEALLTNHLRSNLDQLRENVEKGSQIKITVEEIKETESEYFGK
ncbi:MAG: GTPase [Gammaproteobacteria bacterium]